MKDKQQPHSDHSLKARRLAQEKLTRSKLYMIIAVSLAVGSFVISLSLYIMLGHGSPIFILQQPSLIPLLIVPFFPALFMAVLSRKKYSEAVKILDPPQN